MFIKKYNLEIIAFISGMSIMILELIGIRILAPQLGTSLFIWTSVIGVILGCLSLGYHYGGKLADEKPSPHILGFILLLSAGALFLLALIKIPLLEHISYGISDLRLAGLVASLVLFGPPTVLLAMVAPYAVKLKLSDAQKAGETVGNLYAISTIGSILGTFLTGFVLLSYLRTSQILYALVLLIILASILTGYKKRNITATLCVGALAAIGISMLLHKHLAQQHIVYTDTAYQHVAISPAIEHETKRPMRALSTGPGAYQSIMYVDDPNEIAAAYTKFYDLGHHFNPNIQRVLMIGGAAYSYPKHFLQTYPDATIDVVEIDPKVTALAKQHFGLQDNPRLRTIHEDGRVYLNKNELEYDALYIDAFQGAHAIPFHLTTDEAMGLMAKALSDDGVLILNLISPLGGEKGKFLRAELATVQKHFSHITVYPVTSDVTEKTQNIMIIARKNATAEQPATPEIQELLAREWTEPIEQDVPILTDDLAPVEQYIRHLYL